MAQRVLYVGRDGKLAWTWADEQVRAGFFRSLAQLVVTAITEMRERREANEKAEGVR